MYAQVSINFGDTGTRASSIIEKVQRLIDMHKEGLLGGQLMPEDANPGLETSSSENYHYFTLPMALNYQRDSYKLWAAANRGYLDSEVADIFIPSQVVSMSVGEVKNKLTKHKIALQPNKHTEIWMRLSNTICEYFNGDIRELFLNNGYAISSILEEVQKTKKKYFPYLSGSKICVYWLYVIEQYAGAKYTGREHLTIAPDTHVIQSSIRLGVVDEDVLGRPNMRDIVSVAWNKLLSGSGLLPIDIHTPLWLWSRGGFRDISVT